VSGARGGGREVARAALDGFAFPEEPACPLKIFFVAPLPGAAPPSLSLLPPASDSPGPAGAPRAARAQEQ